MEIYIRNGGDTLDTKARVLRWKWNKYKDDDHVLRSSCKKKHKILNKKTQSNKQVLKYEGGT